jgi:cytidine deaminase
MGVYFRGLRNKVQSKNRIIFGYTIRTASDKLIPMKTDTPVIPEPVRDLLIQAARWTARHAYSPYSHYPVGAAVLMADGQVYTGCNVENASFGLSLCAERAAIAKALSHGNRSFAALAVVGGTPKKPAVPCGACRQVMSEFMAPDTPVYVAPLKSGKPTTTTLGALLPNAFVK